MRIKCPHCGDRDMREFYYQGDAVMTDRPDPAAGVEPWDNYLHLRKNPAGVTRELWMHENGCGAWIVAERDTTTHEFLSTILAKGVS